MSSDAPADDPAPGRRFEIVLAHDGAAGGADALALAVALSYGHEATTAVVATIVVPFPPHTVGDPPIHVAAGTRDWEELCDDLRARGLQRLEEQVVPRLMGLEGLEVHKAVELDDSPPRGLMLLCEERHPDLLVLGSSHRGVLGRILPGATAERLLAGAPCSMVITPAGYSASPPEAISRIGVGFDGSDLAVAAVEEAARLALRLDARLEVISVVPPPSQVDAPRAAVEVLAGHGLIQRSAERLRDAANDLVATLPDQVRASVVIDHGEPSVVLRHRSASGLDLLVLGPRGYGPVRRVLLGSVSGRLVRDCECPLIVAAGSGT